ncbi:glycosyl hydrolase family 16 protein [Aureococcus anophagefferens]|uniref:Glycosyl hydrolase family 16 protein n=1 Tax=Aureococcus anophagefferens TaxID=44056 RepID=A0ABR1FT59_AURAN
MRELKPILCEMCKQACAGQPDDVGAFFVAYLEKRPVFLSPLYHLERFGSMGSFEPPKAASPRPDDEDRDPAPPPRLPTPRVDVDAHRLKVQRLALPAWWLPCERWKLVWHDDFDYDGPPDPRKWGFQTSCNRWIHDTDHAELQHYTSGRRENAWVEGGVLRVTARREPWGDHAYTSARLHTKLKGDWLYGRIEVCARLPPARRGLWPALWLLPTDSKYGRWPRSGEIDLCENIGWQPAGTIHTSVHTAVHNHRERTHSHAATTVADAHDKFHVYSLVWRPTQLLLCIDGETVHSFERGEAPVRRSKESPGDDDASSRASGDSGATRGAEPECTDWPFDQRFFLLINLAVGGTWGGKHGVDDAALPASLEIAYVRVFQER